MNKIIVSLLSATVLGITPITVSAISFRDIDNAGGVVINSSSSASGDFNIVTGDGDSITIAGGYTDNGTTYSDVPGFVPGAMHVTSASAFFYFRDDASDPGNQADVRRVTLDGNLFINAGGNLATPTINGGPLDPTITLALDSDGILHYVVSIPGGGGPNDYIFDYARLEVEAATVPDSGSTVILLGVGFLCLAGLRGKFGPQAQS